MKKLNFIAIILLISSFAFAQSPFNFNYQAVARDAQGQALKNQSVSLRISLLDGGYTGPSIFSEIHQVTSSNLGIINLLIGKGQNQSGFLSNLNWKTKKYWLKVEMDATGGSNYTLMGTTQLVSVPYALHAETATHVDDADANPSNELQQLSFNTVTNELSISNGNKITIPTGGTDADADPNNEIQTVSKSGNTVTLSKNGGTFTVDDADADPNNELQQLSFNTTTNQLTITNGNSVTIPSGGTDADADPNNEIQTLSKNGNTVTLSKNGGSFTDAVDDADADKTNELQSLDLSGNTLLISNGNQVDLTPFKDNTDAQNLSINGNELSISGGNKVTLPGSSGSSSDKITDADGDTKVQVEKTLNDNTIRFDIIGTERFAMEFGRLKFLNSFNNILIGDAPQLALDDYSESNIAIGTQALANNKNKSNMVAIGDSALYNNSIGATLQIEATENTAVGSKTLFSNTLGAVNTAIGFEALKNNTTGHANVAIGSGALKRNTDRGGLVAIGVNALANNSIGTQVWQEAIRNVAVGENALYKNTVGYENTAIGSDALYYNIDGYDNTAVGSNSLENNTEGYKNTAIGSEALYSNEDGWDNTAIGEGTMRENTTGSFNTATGMSALKKNTSGNSNAAFGDNALYSNTIGGSNVAMGNSALKSNTSGYSNVAIGDKALYKNTNISNIVAIGDSALYYNSVGASNVFHSTFNTAVGSKALYKNTIGAFNTATGTASLKNNIIGVLNSSFGAFSLVANSEGNSNSAFGESSLNNNTTGSDNAAFGRQALLENIIGSSNTALGTGAGYSSKGNRNIFIGYNAGYNETGNDKLYIDNSDTNKPLIYGDFAEDKLKVNGDMVVKNNVPTIELRADEYGIPRIYSYENTKIGNLNIGTKGLCISRDGATYADNYPLRVVQDTSFGLNLFNGTTENNWEIYVGNGGLSLYSNNNYVGVFDKTTGVYTSVSDERLKSNIRPMSSTLESVLKLEPSRYEYIRNNPSKIETIGFIAQDVQKLFPELVKKSSDKKNNGTYTVDYAGFGVIAIKSIQEQQKLIESQNKKLTEQQNEIDNLKSRLEKIEKMLLSNSNYNK